VRLANPIASHMSVMRTTLLGGLMQTLRSNLNRGEARVRCSRSAVLRERRAVR
jgi:phenylalanyl-tRNA synthetase beta chain